LISASVIPQNFTKICERYSSPRTALISGNGVEAILVSWWQGRAQPEACPGPVTAGATAEPIAKWQSPLLYRYRLRR